MQTAIPSTSTSTAVKPVYNFGYIWLICLVAAMGGLLFGYDWVVIGGAKPFFEKYFQLNNETLSGWANSCALLGCLLGSVISGYLSDMFGRKKLLIISAVLFAISSVLTGWASTFLLFVVWRIAGGVAIGMASNLSPMYIAEVSPAHMRGRLVAINQLTIVIGILAAQIVNMMIARPVPAADQIRLLLNETSAAQVMAGDKDFNLEKQKASALSITEPQFLALVKEKFPNLEYSLAKTAEEKEAKTLQDNEIMAVYIQPTWNGQYGWRWMFTAVAIPSLIFLLGSLLVPESPRWLVKNGNSDTARKILAKIGGSAYGDEAVRDIEKTIVGEEVQHVRLQDLKEPKMAKILIIGMALAVLQQWSGINVIFNYAEEIYRSAGYGVSDILFNIVITGVINLLFTLIAIGTVDNFGRRGLMLLGCAGIGISHLLIGLAYAMGLKGIMVLIFTLCTIGCYGMSLAPITWVLISEIFPNRIRGVAISIAVSALWIACFLLTFLFPIMNKQLGSANTFWVFAGICLLGFVFIWMKVPETKGKTLEQIERELVD